MKKYMRKKKKKRTIGWKESVRVGALLFAIALFLYFFSAQLFMLRGVHVENQKDPYGEEQIRDFIEHEYFSHRYFFLPQRNKWISMFFLKKRLQEHFPQFKNIQVQVKGNQVFVTFLNRKKDAVWCTSLLRGGEGEERAKEKCYFGDKNSFLFSDAPYFSDGLLKKFFSLDIPIKKGEQVFSEKQFHLISILQNSIEQEFGGHIAKIIFKEDADQSIFMDIVCEQIFEHTNPEGTEIHLFVFVPERREDLESFFQKLSVLEKTKQFQKEFFEEGKKLKSIDARFDGQVRYTVEEV